MKKKSFLINILFTVLVGAVIALICQLNLLDKFELRLYDGLLHLTKDPELSDRILAVEIDDDDIDKLGDWPWSRDILADKILRLKELGAEQVTFDIEYISTSPKSVASNAEENINNKISEKEALSAELVNSVAASIMQGYPKNEAGKLANDMVNEVLYPAFDDLYNYVNGHIAADNDEYFAKCLQFFGNSWLTVNNQDLHYTSITADDINYIRNRMLNFDVTDEKNNIHNDNIYTYKESYSGVEMGFTPALHKLIAHSQGVGFTNSNVDSDGTRRRMELFYEYDGKYLPQLAFGPLLHTLDCKKLTRTKNALILHNALFPGEKERSDVKIPLDEHGRMLINWQHESTDDNKENNLHYGCTFISIRPLHNLDLIEENIYKNLKVFYEDYPVFDEEGYPLPFYYDAAQLVDTYNSLKELKESLLEKCKGYNEDGTEIDGISPEEYSDYYLQRDAYFSSVSNFAENEYDKYLYNLMADQIETDEDVSDWFKDFESLYADIKAAIESYKEQFDDAKKLVNNKYCIIGQVAASTTDIGATSFVKQYANVLIHINLLNTILTKNFITPYPWYYGFIVSFVISILLCILSGSSTSIQNLIGGAVRLVVIGAFILVFILFKIYIPILSGVILYLTTDYLVGVIYRYFQSSKEKKFITEIASSFANKDTVAQLKANPDAFKTEGQLKFITPLFTDIQKFSTFSEGINKIYGEDGPNKLIAVLNEYLGAMSNEILFNAGTIDKYEGDAIISMFGAPDPMNTHTPEEWAYMSLDSAIRMKKQEIEFNETHKQMFEPVEITNADGEKEVVQLKPLQTRIGINSGYTYVGLMGSKTEAFSKLNYTMIGDSVNLASRLEGVNKAYGTWILCSEETWKMANTGINEGKITVRRLDKVRVVGRSTPVQLYNVVGFTDELSLQKKDQIEVFENALDKYLEKDFQSAYQLFVQASKMCNGDDTSVIFAERCKVYIKKGVPENWDGVMQMTSK